MNLNFREIFDLNVELNGFVTGEGKVIFEGLRKQKMNLEAKIYIDRLNKQVSSNLKDYEEQRLELYKKYGTEEGESITLVKENIPAFEKEHNELLSIEVIIDTNICWGEKNIFDLIKGIETTEDYPIFYKLIGQ